MIHEATLLRINTAIRTCLDRCYSHRQPLAAMAEFLQDLRQRPGWRQAEVEEVEFTVRRILKAIVARQDGCQERAGTHAENPTGSADIPESTPEMSHNCDQGGGDYGPGGVRG